MSRNYLVLVYVKPPQGGGFTNLLILMINHNIMRLDISVHYSLAVTEIQGLQKFVDVETDIVIIELRVQAAEVGVVDILKDK